MNAGRAPKLWIQTTSGRKFWPKGPWEPDDFDIRDIARALSMNCRFGGHVAWHYSVAQHSVYVSALSDPGDALAGLLHDAAEAYMVDVPRPIKYAPWMDGYRKAQDELQLAIAEHFGVMDPKPPSVHRADNVMLKAEAYTLKSPIHDDWSEWLDGIPDAPQGFRIEPWTPAMAEAAFLTRFGKLARKTV